MKRHRRRRINGFKEFLKGGTCRYRSSWELKFMEMLDEDPTVVSFKYEYLKIPYVSNKRTGKTRNYIPDLLVTYDDGNTIVVEIKPLSRICNVVNKKKFDAAKEWCRENGYTFEVITEVELRSMGVL